MRSAINGAFAFWAVGVVLVLILSLFERAGGLEQPSYTDAE